MVFKYSAISFKFLQLILVKNFYLSFLFSMIRKEKEKSFALWMNLVAKIFLLFCFFFVK